MTTSDVAVRLDSVTKRYRDARDGHAALDDVSVAIPQASFTAVMGTSGSGKSTFLQCAAGLDQPTSGSVFLGSSARDLSTLSETELTVLRRRQIGFVFQSFNLVPELTVRQNITLPLRLAGKRTDRSRVAELLARVGLAGRGRDLPSQLSGGQQQRVAIARALITRPDVIFADEPTGSLDMVSARGILTLLRQAVDTTPQTVVMVTHDPVAASYADSVIFLSEGRIAQITPRRSAGEIADRVTRLATSRSCSGSR